MKEKAIEIRRDLKNDVEKIVLFFKNNKVLIGLIIIAALLTWGYELTNFTRTIDDEQTFSRGINVKLWISQNRFTIAAIRALIPYEIIPYWHTFLFIVITCITGVFIAFFVDQIISNKLASTCAAVIFVSMPVHVYYESFSMYCEEMALAYLLTALSVYCVFQWCNHTKAFHYAIAGCILEIAALGVYQGFVPVYIIFVCTVLLLNIISKVSRDSMPETHKTSGKWEDLFRYVGVFLLSLLLYFCIGEGVKAFLHIQNDYLDGYMRWNKDSIAVCVNEIIHSIKGCSLFPLTHRGYVTIPFTNLLLLAFTILGFIKAKRYRVLFVLSCVGIYFSSIFFFVVMGGYMPPRAMLGMPLYVAFVMMLSMNLANKKWIQYLLVIATVFVVLYQSACAVKLNSIAQNAQESDRVRVESVSEEIAALGKGSIPEEPVAFVGLPVAYESVFWEGDSTMGYSYFTLGKERLQAYFTLLGYRYNWCSEEEQAKAEVLAENMPGWPMEGSVIEENGVIIVNFKGYLINTESE